MDPTRRAAARLATFVALPVAIAVAGLSAWVLGGFERARSVPTGPTTLAVTAPVPLPARTLSPAVAAVCRAVVARLPASTPAGLRRPVGEASEQSAAYGTAVVLQCGTAPPRPARDADLAVLNGVCWYAEPAGTMTIKWTTVDREVPVSVFVVGSEEGSAQLVIPFSVPIAGADAPRSDAPGGCHLRTPSTTP